MVRRGKQELEALMVMTPFLVGVTNPHASDEITAKHSETFIFEVRPPKPRYVERSTPSRPEIRIRDARAAFGGFGTPKVRFTCVCMNDWFFSMKVISSIEKQR